MNLDMLRPPNTPTDILQSLSSDEQRLFRMYGKLPNKKDLLQNKLKVSTHSCEPSPVATNSFLGAQIL